MIKITENKYLAKIYKKNSKVSIKNVCTQDAIDSFKDAGFEVEVIKEIQDGDKKYFFENVIIAKPDAETVKKPAKTIKKPVKIVKKPVNNDKFKCPIGWSIEECDSQCFYQTDGVCTLEDD